MTAGTRYCSDGRGCPPGPAARPEAGGVRLVELDAGWLPDPGQAHPLEHHTALVVAPTAVLDQVRAAAEAALPGYRLAFAGIGTQYRREAPGVWTVGAEE